MSSGLTQAMVGLVALSCATTRPEPPPERYLEDAYPANAAAAAVAPVRQMTTDVQRHGDHRRHVVTGPDGQTYALRWRKVSESVGRPQDGHLRAPARLPKEGAGYHHTGKAPWGTDETVAYLRYAAWITAHLHPGTGSLLVRDLSDEDGGRLYPHKSHRTGRDADVGWYFLDKKRDRWFRSPKADTPLDLPRCWTYLEALLRTGAVQHVFVHRRIQKALHEYALSRGWDEDTLAGIFQYPNGDRRSIVRHVKGHLNHLHVRFVCPSEDADCED